MDEETQALSFSLRPMVLSDIDAVLKIEQASFPTPWPREAFLYELARPGRSVCRVAEAITPEDAPVILGDIVVWLAGKVAHVATLAVHPDHRDRKSVV